MCEFSSVEFNRLWSLIGNRNFEFEGYVNGKKRGQMAYFRHTSNRKNTVGKIVKYPQIGESYYWSRLCHANLMPLHETCKINSFVTVFMMPRLGMTLYERIRDTEFCVGSKPFFRKKAYMNDVLHGLNFLHNKRLCLMNLSEKNIWIDVWNDKAVIGNFSCLTAFPKVTKGLFQVGELFRPPEFIGFPMTSYMEAEPAEIWMYGVLAIQVFCCDYLSCKLPAKYSVSDSVLVVLSFLKNLSEENVVKLNPCWNIPQQSVQDLKKLLDKIININPQSRITANCATKDIFWEDSARCRSFTDSPSLKINPSLKNISAETHGQGVSQIPTTNPFAFADWESRRKLDSSVDALTEKRFSDYGDFSMNLRWETSNPTSENKLSAVRQDLSKASPSIRCRLSQPFNIEKGNQNTRISEHIPAVEESLGDIQSSIIYLSASIPSTTFSEAKPVISTGSLADKMASLSIADNSEKGRNKAFDNCGITQEVRESKCKGDNVQANDISQNVNIYSKEHEERIYDSDNDDDYLIEKIIQNREKIDTYYSGKENCNDTETTGISSASDEQDTMSSEQEKEDNIIHSESNVTSKGFVMGFTRDDIQSLLHCKDNGEDDGNCLNSMNPETTKQALCPTIKNDGTPCCKEKDRFDPNFPQDQNFINSNLFYCSFSGDLNSSMLLDQDEMLGKDLNCPGHITVAQPFHSDCKKKDFTLSPLGKEDLDEKDAGPNEINSYIYFNPNYPDPDNSSPLLTCDKHLVCLENSQEDVEGEETKNRTNELEKIPAAWKQFCDTPEPAYIAEEYTTPVKKEKKRKKKKRCDIL